MTNSQENKKCRKKHRSINISQGASAILQYNTVRSPLGQPRNAILGQTFSAIIGVGVTKLFLFHPEFERLRWVAGALSCGLASAVRLLTNTVHPPGGASAALAATYPQITTMGWYFVGLVVLGTVLMLLVGLVINNLQRQFPIYWWTPMDVGRARQGDGGDEGSSGGTFADEDGTTESIFISARAVTLPVGLELSEEEEIVLRRLKGRLEGKASSRSSDKEVIV